MLSAIFTCSDGCRTFNTTLSGTLSLSHCATVITQVRNSNQIPFLSLDTFPFHFVSSLIVVGWSAGQTPTKGPYLWRKCVLDGKDRKLVSLPPGGNVKAAHYVTDFAVPSRDGSFCFLERGFCLFWVLFCHESAMEIAIINYYTISLRGQN